MAPAALAQTTQSAGPGDDEKVAPRVYTVPFGSRGNTVALELVNAVGAPAGHLQVEATRIPGWIELTPAVFSVGRLDPGRQAEATFTFHLDEQAPVGQTDELVFVARSASGVAWSTTIRLKAGAPAEFALDPNYPNPFNPSTTIAYRLPASMRVNVTVFNLLGQRIATLADELQPAGAHTLRWDAGRLASGLYFYRVIAEGEAGRRIVEHRKMMLIK